MRVNEAKQTAVLSWIETENGESFGNYCQEFEMLELHLQKRLFLF